MIKKALIMIFCMLFFFSITFAEDLNLNPKYYQRGDIVQEECISLSPDDFEKVIEEIKDNRKILELREEQIENSEVIKRQYEDLLENSKLKINLYKDNIDLYKEDITIYREELNKYQDKYLNLVKFNSYRTGFTFVLGISTAILTGWVFSEIAK